MTRITKEADEIPSRAGAACEAARQRKRSAAARPSTANESAAASGLVISDITCRGVSRSIEKPQDNAVSVASVWSPKFPTPDLVDASVSLFDSIRDGGEPPEFPRLAHRLIVSPGSIQLSRKQLWDFPDLVHRESEHESEIDLLFSLEDECELAKNENNAGKKQAITEWSRKSRANMVRRLATLDYSPILNGDSLPGLVTLTLPGDWLSVCPDGGAFQRYLQAFKHRYQRDWGKLYAIWKREFQRRGAAHFHLFMPIPTGLCERTGETFHDWLSRSWAEIVGATGEEFDKHLRAGTGIDFSEAINMRDPRRLAIYFLKAESGTGETTSKEYQHRVPAEWEGKKIGRWWGYWGLEIKTSAIELTREDWLFISRTMRRYSRSRARRVQVRRPRQVIDTKTGEVKKTITRKTGVRQTFFKSGAGFQVLNDAPAFASKLALYLAGIHRSSTSSRSPQTLAELEAEKMAKKLQKNAPVMIQSPISINKIR